MHENPTCLRQACTIPRWVPQREKSPEIRNTAIVIVATHTVLRTYKLSEVAVFRMIEIAKFR